MPSALKHQLAILAIGCVVLFTNLGGSTLFDEDEPKNAACGQEMFARGEWIVPWFNGELRTDKPILLYWFMLAAYHTFGINEFAARATSAMCGIGTALVTYHLGRILFRPNVGLWAAIALLTCLMFGVVARAATPDSLFVFLTTTALLIYVAGADRAAQNLAPPENDGDAPRETPGSRAAGVVACRPYGLGWYVALYAAISLAVLAKGPAGFVLPSAVLFGFSFLVSIAAQMPEDEPPSARDGLRQWWSALRHAGWFRLGVQSAAGLRPLVGLGVLAVVVLPWYVAVGVKTDGQWLAGFLGHHNVGRFVHPLEGHRGPFFYYALALIAGMFPWSIFFPQALRDMARAIVRRENRMPAFLFLGCWALVIVAIFSVARTKLPNYVLPAYPALSLCIAAFVDRWSRRPETVAQRALYFALASYGLVGLGMIVGLAVAASRLFPGDAWLAAIGLVPIAGSVAAILWHHAGRPKRAAYSLAASAVLLALGLLGGAAAVVSRNQTSPYFAALARQAGARRLVTYEYFEPSLVFYHRSPVTRLHDPREVARMLAEDPDVCVVTSRERWAELRPWLPDDVQLLAARQRFLRDDEVALLVGRTTLQARSRSQPRR